MAKIIGRVELAAAASACGADRQTAVNNLWLTNEWAARLPDVNLGKLDELMITVFKQRLSTAHLASKSGPGFCLEALQAYQAATPDYWKRL